MKNWKKKLGKHQDDGDDEDEGDGGVLLVKAKKKEPQTLQQRQDTLNPLLKATRPKPSTEKP